MQRALALSYILLTAANANDLSAPLGALRQSEHHQIIKGILPAGSLSHFCIVTGWNEIDALLARFALMLGIDPPQTGISGGPSSNGTYRNPEHNGTAERLQGSNRIAFIHVNNDTSIEFLGADDKPSWWSYLYAKKGMEVCVGIVGCDLAQEAIFAVQTLRARLCVHVFMVCVCGSLPGLLSCSPSIVLWRTSSSIPYYLRVVGACIYERIRTCVACVCMCVVRACVCVVCVNCKQASLPVGPPPCCVEHPLAILRDHACLRCIAQVHHMGYELPPGEQIWPVVEAFAKAGLGKPVQW